MPSTATPLEKERTGNLDVLFHQARVIHRQIRSSLGYIDRKIAQDVYQLQSLPKLNAKAFQFGFCDSRIGDPFERTKSGPEFSNRTCDQIYVFFQLIGVAQRVERISHLESLDIQALAPDYFA